MAFGSHLLHLFWLIVVFLHFFTILTAAQSECNITLNSEMTAGAETSPWRSPSGDFAFGFRPILTSNSGNREQENVFLLAIWFDKIPEQTIVWSRDEHVKKGSKIQLTADGALVLYDPQPRGQERWRAPTGNERSACAAMLDSGNFVLINKDSSRYIWESFNEPTDTILPGQRIGMDGNLTSRTSESEYGDGRFQLRMQPDGNLVLYTISVPTQVSNGAYWASMTTPPNPNASLVFDEAGFMYVQDGDKTIFNVTDRGLGRRQDQYQRATLDYDGVFRHYQHPKLNYVVQSSGSRNCPSPWNIVQTIPNDVCSRITNDLGSGACGYNSYCKNINGWPKCFCPDGFSPLDQLDPRRGCKPDFPVPSCQQNGWELNADSVDFKELNNTNWPLSDYDVQRGNDVDKERCKQFCLEDCFCGAAIYNLNGSCFKKKFPLSNGRWAKDLIGIALIKVPKNNDTATFCPKSRDQSKTVIVISALLGSSVFLNMLLLAAITVAILFVYHKNLMNLLRADANLHGVKRYTYKELEEATGGFKQQLGRGSFGTVYKGVLITSIPRRYIAVKCLDNVETEGEKEFKMEVSTIGRTHHKNLVTLLGYCDEGSHRLLVYEYMSNGSLASFLFGLSRPHWNQRMRIASGIARGLTYLHEECSNTQIIHCDVKPQNILLDESLTPRISDFGLAKLLLSEQSRATRSHIRGTIGYFAPEWFRKASITVKVDVYSFGVMLLEMICCTSSVAFSIGGEDEALVDWVYECYSRRNVERLVENDEEARNDMKGVERAVMVGIWCIQEDPSLRPSMRRVTQMLDGDAEVSVPPRPSVFTL